MDRCAQILSTTAALCFLLWADGCLAWQLRFDNPTTYLRDSKGGPPANDFDTASPVHEELTLNSLGCVGDNRCNDDLALNSISVADVLRGVRWNDFPAVYFDKSPTGTCKGLRRASNSSDIRCFGATAYYSGGLSRSIKGDKYSNESIFVRGHFGDLQAWHSMASLNEEPKETLDGMMGWAKLWWAIVRGEVDLRADVTTVTEPVVARRFYRGSRQVYNFVDYRTDGAVRSIALGAILHMVQDSFAPCHTERDANGHIVRFNTYSGQNRERHHNHDGHSERLEHVVSLPNGPTVVGKRLVRLATDSALWETVRTELLQTWMLSPDAKNASPGVLCQ